MIHSLQVERHVLSGLIKYQNIFHDIDHFISEVDFYNNVHEVIFAVIKDLNVKNIKIDKVLLAEKIKNLGISFKDDINIYDYIDNLSYSQITEEATVEAAKELLKLRIRREIFNTANKIQQSIKENTDEDVDSLISKIDKIYNEKISAYSLNQKPEEIFNDLESLIEEIGNNPVEESGLVTPYSEFNRLYGGLRNKNLYAIVSRPGQGKTTWLNDITFKTSLSNKNVHALVLDTEMSTYEIKLRMMASLSQVPLWYIETGSWRKNEEMVKKVRMVWAKIKNFKYHHYHVGNKNIDQIVSIIRRWYYSEVGRGNQAIISYDYIKLTGEKIGQNWAEHQAIGDKIDKLKKISEEISAPLITAMQMNRSGESFNRSSSELVDDSSAIALSDRLQWFASFVAIFRRKTLDEVALDGNQFGTHKLIPIKTRFQGKDAAGHQDLIRRRDSSGKDKWITNFINYNVSNFNIEERGSARDIVAHERNQHDLDDKNQNDGELL